MLHLSAVSTAIAYHAFWLSGPSRHTAKLFLPVPWLFVCSFYSFLESPLPIGIPGARTEQSVKFLIIAANNLHEVSSGCTQVSSEALSNLVLVHGPFTPSTPRILPQA